MKCRTSCFNSALCRHYLRRFWPFPAAMLLFCLVVFNAGYTITALRESGGYADSYADIMASQLSGYTVAAILLLAAAALVAALLVFHSLHARNEGQFYLSLPMTRACSYVSAFVSGYLTALLPMLLCAGLMLPVALANGCSVKAVLVFLLFGLAAWTLFYSMAVVCCTLAGNRIGAALMYAGSHCIFFILLCGIATIAAWLVPGLSPERLPDGIWLHLTPVAALINAGDRSCFLPEAALWPLLRTPLLCILAGLLLAAAGLWLYRSRRAEQTGATAAFTGARVACILLGSAVVCIGGTIITTEICCAGNPFPDAVVMLLLLGWCLVGWAAAEMIVQRSFRFFTKTALLRAGTLAALILLLFSAAELDLLGISSRTCSADEIASASLMAFNRWADLSPEDAEAIHKTILAHSEELISPMGSSDCVGVELDLKLKNGKTLTRSYYIQADESAVSSESALLGAIYDLLEQPEYCLQTWLQNFPAEPDEDMFISGLVQYSRTTDLDDSEFWTFDKEYNLTAEDAQALLAAFRADVQNGLVPPDCNYGNPLEEQLGSLYLEYHTEAYDPAVSSLAIYRADREHIACTALPILPGMTATLEALEKLGISLAAVG